MDYHSFFQEISTNNIIDSTVECLGDLHIKLLQEKNVYTKDQLQKTIDELSRRSALNQYAKGLEVGDKKAKILSTSLKILKTKIIDLELLEINVLLFAAHDPKQDQINLITEQISNIEKKLNQKSIYNLKLVPHTTLDIMIQTIVDFEPHIIHFAGHSEKEGLFLAPDDEGGSQLTNDEFITILKYAGSQLKFLFLNSCKSSVLSKLIAEKNQDFYILSWDDKVSVRLATNVSDKFYELLSKNKTYKESAILSKLYPKKERGKHGKRHLHIQHPVLTKTKKEKKKKELSLFQKFIKRTKEIYNNLKEKFKPSTQPTSNKNITITPS